VAKTVVRCRNPLKTRLVGKSGHVNGLVKNGPGGRGKSNSYSLKTRRAEQVHGSHVTLLEARGRRKGKSRNGLVEKRGNGQSR
jgi:hypothetical protein